MIFSDPGHWRSMLTGSSLGSQDGVNVLHWRQYFPPLCSSVRWPHMNFTTTKYAIVQGAERLYLLHPQRISRISLQDIIPHPHLSFRERIVAGFQSDKVKYCAVVLTVPSYSGNKSACFCQSPDVAYGALLPKTSNFFFPLWQRILSSV